MAPASIALARVIGGEDLAAVGVLRPYRVLQDSSRRRTSSWMVLTACEGARDSVSPALGVRVELILVLDRSAHLRHAQARAFASMNMRAHPHAVAEAGEVGASR